jgi:ribonuclease-3
LKLEKSREEILKAWLQNNNLQFEDLELLDLALTHASWPKDINKNNKRLAFLGDAVIDLLIADLLFTEFSEKDAGSLTKMREGLVNKNYLAEIGAILKIEEIVQTSGIAKDGMKKVIGETIEAVIGAMFLNKGWEDTKQTFEKLLWRKFLRNSVYGTHS